MNGSIVRLPSNSPPRRTRPPMTPASRSVRLHLPSATPALILGLLLLAAASSAQTVLCTRSNANCNQIDAFSPGTGACTWSVQPCNGLVLDSTGDVSCTLESQTSVRIETVTSPGVGTCTNAVEEQYKEVAPQAIEWYLGVVNESCTATCLAQTGSAENCNAAAINTLASDANVRSVAAYLGVANAGSITIQAFPDQNYPGYRPDNNELRRNSNLVSTCEAPSTSLPTERFCCCSLDSSDCPPNPTA
mmetsp:Transcript_16745/g.43143  ORF Transcript_16745/g.43143 Transcript_16745/m.43143 type:complete len:247 (+) Transcript_16745:354-1094(+)